MYEFNRCFRTSKCDLKNKICKKKITPEIVIILKVTKVYNAINIKRRTVCRHIK